MLAGLGAHLAWHRFMTDEAGQAELGRRPGGRHRAGRGRRGRAGLVERVLDYAREAAERGLRRYSATKFAVPLAARAATLGLLAVKRRRPRSARLVAAGLLVVVAVDMLWFFVPINPVPPREQFYQRTPAHRFLADHLGQARMSRGASRPSIPTPTSSTASPTSAATPSISPPTSTCWRRSTPRCCAPRPCSPSRPEVDPGSPILDLLGVRYWSEDERQPVRGRRLDDAAPAAATLDPAGGGATTRLRVPAGGLRAVELLTRRLPGSGGRLTVEVVGADGQVLASGERRLWTLQRDRWEQVVLAGDGLPAGAEVTLRVGTDEAPGRVGIAAAAAGPAYRLVAGRDDGLRVAFGAGVVIYERLGAQPLARLYGGYEVLAGEPAVARLAALPAASRRALVEAAVPGLPPGRGQGRRRRRSRPGPPATSASRSTRPGPGCWSWPSPTTQAGGPPWTADRPRSSAPTTPSRPWPSRPAATRCGSATGRRASAAARP